MRHPFDGLNINDGFTRRGALRVAAGAVAGLVGLAGPARGEAVALEIIIDERTQAGPPTTEPFGEEAGSVVSQPAPGLEDGGGIYQSEKLISGAKGEGGYGYNRVHVAPGSMPRKDDVLRTAWRDLGSKEVAVGVQGCAILYGAKEGVAFLKSNLKVEALREPQADRRDVARWIEELDANAFKVRQAAENELEKAGASAVAAMQRTLKAPKSIEQRKRLERLVEQSAENSPVTRGKRALEVLVALGTPEAKELLVALSKGDDREWLTRAARDALGRIPKGTPGVTFGGQ